MPTGLVGEVKFARVDGLGRAFPNAFVAFVREHVLQSATVTASDELRFHYSPALATGSPQRRRPQRKRLRGTSLP